MDAKAECLACMFKQALNTVRQVTQDDAKHIEVLRRLAAYVAAVELDDSPAVLSQPVYRIVADVTGETDPFRDAKRAANTMALGMRPALRGKIRSSAAPLDTALHISAAGNVIDAGIGHDYDIERDMADLLATPFAINDIDAFEAELTPGTRLLFLGDNAGEIVFDVLLVELLRARGVDVTYVVKSGPIINDATMEDARAAGLPELVNVIETGSDDIGVHFGNASAAFREAFDRADIILGKGHGNFETCNTRPENLYFLLKAKCPMVAAALGVTMGNIVFKRSRSYR